MRKRLGIKNKINIELVKQRVNDYPQISNLLESEINSFSEINTPTIEQVHIFIEWLYRFQDTSKALLYEIERVLNRISNSDVKNVENLFRKLSAANDKEQFDSVYSELFLLNHFILNGIKVEEYEPIIEERNLADFKLIFEKDEVFIELISPHYPQIDYEEKQNTLFQQIERVDSKFLVRISGFELIDFNYGVEGKRPEIVIPPNNSQIQEIILNFRNQASKIYDNKLPVELTKLCETYQRIKIEIVRRLSKEEIEHLPDTIGTYVAITGSRSGEGMPIDRFLKIINNEKKHFSTANINFIFIDLSNWSVIDRHYLEHEGYRKLFIENIEKKISSKIDGIFTYMVSNKKDERLLCRRVLYIRDSIVSKQNKELSEFINSWTLDL